ncbi:MAG: cell division protein FtsB [Candidatus Azotimanducaceae bacterium]|jgi:cell division protein FtsB
MFIGLQFRLWIGPGSFAHVNGLQKKMTHADAANTVKEERNKVLRVEIRDLKDGLETVEEKARTELGLIKEDETFFLLVDKDKD